MKTITINTKPTPDSESTNITLMVDNLDFVYKAPLSPWILSMPGATFQVETLDTSKFLEMIKFDTPEGLTSYMNKKNLLGYLTPELGTYILVFNGARLGVKTTEAEIKQKLGIGSSLIV